MLMGSLGNTPIAVVTVALSPARPESLAILWGKGDVGGEVSLM